MFEENTCSEEGLLLFQKAVSYHQNKLYSFLHVSCLCLAAMLWRCFILWKATGKRFTKQQPCTCYCSASHSIVKLRQALKQAETVRIRSLHSYYRVCFSTQSTHAAASMAKERSTYWYNNTGKYHPAVWSWVTWGRHVNLLREINSAKLEWLKNAIF